MPKSYRVEEWRLEDTLGKMLEILAGYPELEIAKELTTSLIKLLGQIANSHHPPVEVQLSLVKLQKELMEQHLEDEGLSIRDRVRSCLGIGTDPVEEASQRAWKQVEETLTRFGKEDEKLSQKVLMGSQKLLDSVVDKLDKLLDRPELKGKDRQALNEIRKALGKYTKSR